MRPGGMGRASPAMARQKWRASTATSPRRRRSGGSSMRPTARRKKRSSRKRPACTSRSRSRRVAATMRTSTRSHLFAPTRCTSPRSIARRSFGWSVSSSSPISSMKSVPPWACSKTPRRCDVAPVNAPFSWPKSADSSSAGGTAVQSKTTKGAAARGARLVQRLREHLLAGAGLALDDDRDVARGEARAERVEAPHLRALAEHRPEGPRRGGLRPSPTRARARCAARSRRGARSRRPRGTPRRRARR